MLSSPSRGSPDGSAQGRREFLERAVIRRAERLRPASTRRGDRRAGRGGRAAAADRCDRPGRTRRGRRRGHRRCDRRRRPRLVSSSAQRSGRCLRRAC
ncbi:hypothetical protein F8M49_00305 [Rhodococcus zopfii]|uniref:Uncharacterized protein n=1 Tax=Rhodococcus zopfii TaxID=43772 RepID=A0ABU3WJS7_9NOCA|nr:hypothetical protein [Rhodococcus zopfii]